MSRVAMQTRKGRARSTFAKRGSDGNLSAASNIGWSFEQSEAVELRVVPVDHPRLQHAQALFVAVVLEQLLRHEVAPVVALVEIRRRHAGEVGVVAEAAAAGTEQAAEVLQVGADGV